MEIEKKKYVNELTGRNMIWPDIMWQQQSIVHTNRQKKTKKNKQLNFFSINTGT